MTIRRRRPGAWLRPRGGSSPRSSSFSPPRTCGDALLAPANPNGHPGLARGPCGIPAAGGYRGPSGAAARWGHPARQLAAAGRGTA
jgi:hypothetical protein